MKDIGTVIVEVADGLAAPEVRQLVLRGMEQTPSGRVLSVLFPLNRDFAMSLPYEAVITKAVIGSASQRPVEPEWFFFGNLAIRVCKVRPNSREVDSELAVLMFRRSGEMAYRRRHELTKEVVNESLITVGHPVFTRDVANNVWHLPIRGHKSELRRRLAALCTWSDERTLVIRRSSNLIMSHKSLDLDKSLVGVPRKVPYHWDYILR